MSESKDNIKRDCIYMIIDRSHYICDWRLNLFLFMHDCDPMLFNEEKHDNNIMYNKYNWKILDSVFPKSDDVESYIAKLINNKYILFEEYNNSNCYYINPSVEYNYTIPLPLKEKLFDLYDKHLQININSIWPILDQFKQKFLEYYQFNSIELLN